MCRNDWQQPNTLLVCFFFVGLVHKLKHGLHTTHPSPMDVHSKHSSQSCLEWLHREEKRQSFNQSNRHRYFHKNSKQRHIRIHLHQHERPYHWRPRWPLPVWGSAAPPWCWLTSWQEADTKHTVSFFKTGSGPGVTTLSALATEFRFTFKIQMFEKNVSNVTYTDSSPVLLLLNWRRRLFKARIRIIASMSRMQRTKTAMKPFFQPAIFTAKHIEMEYTDELCYNLITKHSLSLTFIISYSFYVVSYAIICM